MSHRMQLSALKLLALLWRGSSVCYTARRRHVTFNVAVMQNDFLRNLGEWLIKLEALVKETQTCRFMCILIEYNFQDMVYVFVL